MNAKVTRGTGEQYIAQRLAFAFAEAVQCVIAQQVVNTGIVEFGYIVIVCGDDRIARNECGKLSRGGVGEDIAVSHVHSRFVGFDDDTRHHERGAAQIEEAVVGTDLVHGENLAEDAAEERFRIVGRCHVFAVGSLHDGRRQRLAVHLLVLVQRNAVDLHRGGRDHVRRFLFANESVEGLDVHLLVTDDVGGDELSTILIIKSLHSSILDAWELANHGLHFLEFDTETTNLYLTVFTSHKLDVAVGEVTHNIAGAIDAGVFRVVAEGVLQVSFSVFFGTVQIAAAYLRPCDPQFTGSAKRQSVKLFVNNIES